MDGPTVYLLPHVIDPSSCSLPFSLPLSCCCLSQRRAKYFSIFLPWLIHGQPFLVLRTPVRGRESGKGDAKFVSPQFPSSALESGIARTRPDLVGSRQMPNCWPVVQCAFISIKEWIQSYLGKINFETF
jgi:hypothetical protein